MTSTSAQANRGGFDTLDYNRFDQWKSDCLSATRDPKELETESKSFFTSQPVHRERALALLIQSLEPAFTATRLKTRHYALTILQGALAAPMALSLSVMKLVGDFLLQHGGPILMETEEPDGEWDMDETVRDSATKAVANLLMSQMPRSNLEDDDQVTDSIRYRVQLSQEAIRRRCALPDREDEDSQRLLGSSAPRGLASLPRSRRTLCFEVLQSTLDGIRIILEIVWAPSAHPRNKSSIIDRVSMSILNWSELTINCLHGESDPRCLIQLLRLLSSLQDVFVHVLEKSFPVDAMFDAVSAYYPVQFSPPKTMSAPVTKQDLAEALWKILSCTKYDEPLAKAGRDTMFSLTLGIILEQLLPLPEDEPPTLLEQKEALEDLNQLLGGSGGESRETFDAIEHDRVGPESLSTISSALRSIHAKTAVQGASDSSATSQQVSLSCRNLIAAVAKACETGRKGYWNAFVKEPVQDIVHGQSRTSWSRPDIVYLSCLAGCGGMKTLHFILDNTLPAFLSILADMDPSAEEEDFLAAKAATQMSLALFGIAALCAAIQTSVEKQQIGVTLNPHPLRKHEVNSAILLAWDQTKDISSVSENCRKSFVALRLAAVRAMETTLLVLPELTDSAQMNELKSFVEDLSQRVIVGEGDGNEDEKLFKSACARLLGIIVGEAMKEDGENSESVNEYPVIRTGLLKEALTEVIFPRILEHVSSPFAQLALAVVCTQSKSAATTTVQKLMTALVEEIQNQPDSRRAIDDMASILTRGGRNASEAFQNSDFLIQLRSVLLPQRSPNVDISTRVSALQLPSTAEEIQCEDAETWQLIGLLEPLLPLYSSTVSTSHLNNLLMATRKVVPPLDSNDRKRFAVLLPFLASALRGANSSVILEKQSVDEIAAYLPDFILSNAPSTARSYAANCLNCFLVRSKSKECPCMALVINSVMPAVVEYVDEIQRLRSKNHSSLDRLSVALSNVEHALTFLGSIASAAILRGGSSTSTADKIVTFVAGLACNSRAYSIGISAAKLIDLQGLDAAGEIIKTSAISAFGSVVSVASMGPISKQRLCYAAWKVIQNCQGQSSQLSMGVVGVSSFIICCANWKGISAAMSTALTDYVLLGLSCEIPLSGTVKKVLLAALIRLMHLNPMFVEKNVVYVVSGVLRAYATINEADGSCLMPCKLLALQALQTLSTVLTPRAVHAVKPAVVSILEQAMFDKSSILRHAAVTCNHYYSGSSYN